MRQQRIFHHLELGVGPHHIEVRAVDSRSLAFDTCIAPHHASTLNGVLPHVHH